jgi:5-hydroxyisourate hydrolase-like protein (transthyretin family)
MSQLTTHILDILHRQPAEGVTIILFKGGNDDAVQEMARFGATNSDAA